jgi:hypothetical protein
VSRPGDSRPSHPQRSKSQAAWWQRGWRRSRRSSRRHFLISRVRRMRLIWW